MSACLEAALPAAPLDPSEEGRAARLRKFRREQLIVDYLNRGVSVAEIAVRFDVGEKRMRAIIREIVARRQPHPPEEFVAIQVGRLNEALLVAYSAMSETNLRAVDRVVKIVRELDRYHGFVAAEGRRSESSRRIAVERVEAPSGGAAAFGLFCRAELAAPDVQIDRPDSPCGDLGVRPRGDDRPKIPLHLPEKAESAPEVPAFPDLIRTSGFDPGEDAPVPSGVAADWSLFREAARHVASRHEGRRRTPDGPTGGHRPNDPPKRLENIAFAPEPAALSEAGSGAGDGASAPTEGGPVRARAQLPVRAGADGRARSPFALNVQGGSTGEALRGPTLASSRRAGEEGRDDRSGNQPQHTENV